jgi:hypothetical protein
LCYLIAHKRERYAYVKICTYVFKFMEWHKYVCVYNSAVILWSAIFLPLSLSRRGRKRFSRTYLFSRLMISGYTSSRTWVLT